MLCALLLLCLLLPLPAALAEMPAQTALDTDASEDATVSVSSIADELPLAEWQQVVDALSGGHRVDVRAMLSEFLRGESPLNADELLGRLLQNAKEQLLDRRGLMLRLIAPALLCSLLYRFRDAFSAKSVAEISHWACFLWVAAVIVEECAQQAQSARAVVDGMATGMQALFPMLLTLLVAVGGTSSASFFQPAVVAASGTMTTLVRSVSFSLALAYAVLVVLDNVSENVSLSKLSGLVKTASSWSLGICFTVFIGVMAVQGFSAAAMDGVTLRTAKYTIDNFVPIIGGMFADTVDTLVASSLLVKNALGVMGLVLLVAYLLTPLLKVLTTVLAMRLVAAVLEPIADTRVVRLIGDASGSLVMLAVTQLCIAAMFFLLVAQLLVVGNMTVMMR